VTEEQVVHVPEPALERGSLGRGGGRESMRVDLGQRKVPEGEADAIAQSCLDALDFSERFARVRAFVVAVLDDEAAGRRAADVIDDVIERFHGDLWLVPRSAGPDPHLGPGPTRCSSDRLSEPETDELVVVRGAASLVTAEAEREVVVVQHGHLTVALDDDVLDRRERERERVAETHVAGLRGKHGAAEQRGLISRLCADRV
jgi:hypothetical protein